MIAQTAHVIDRKPYSYCFKPSIGKYDRLKANFVYPELPDFNTFNFLMDLLYHSLKWNGEVLVALHLRTGFVDIVEQGHTNQALGA
jgi:hypothetical protein